MCKTTMDGHQFVSSFRIISDIHLDFAACTTNENILPLLLQRSDINGNNTNSGPDFQVGIVTSDKNTCVHYVVKNPHFSQQKLHLVFQTIAEVQVNQMQLTICSERIQ